MCFYYFIWNMATKKNHKCIAQKIANIKLVWQWTRRAWLNARIITYIHITMLVSSNHRYCSPTSSVKHLGKFTMRSWTTHTFVCMILKRIFFDHFFYVIDSSIAFQVDFCIIWPFSWFYFALSPIFSCSRAFPIFSKNIFLCFTTELLQSSQEILLKTQLQQEISK